jgi:hypothetical protein
LADENVELSLINHCRSPHEQIVLKRRHVKRVKHCTGALHWTSASGFTYLLSKSLEPYSPARHGE